MMTLPAPSELAGTTEVIFLMSSLPLWCAQCITARGVARPGATSCSTRFRGSECVAVLVVRSGSTGARNFNHIEPF